MALTPVDLKYAEMNDTDKRLYDAGLMSINGEVNEYGWNLLKQLQFESYKKDLVKAVDKINASINKGEK